MRFTSRHNYVLSAALAAAVLLAACSEKAPPPKAGPAEVGVVTVQPRDVPLVYEQVGQTAGFRETEVRSRVAGILQKRLYQEGQAVKEGQALFQIDPEPYKAALDQAKGALRQQEATLERTRADRERIEPLFKENAVSRKDYDDAKSAFDLAQASVDSARAKVREADLNVGYTLVTSPIAGIASKEARSEGSLVATSGDASLLTTVAQLDPLYVNFSYSETEKLELDDAVKAGRVVITPSKKVEARAKLADGRDFAGVGYVDFADSRVDPKTGTIRARAEFPNPKGELLPGQFVRIAITLGTAKNAILVPERAITQQQATRLVLIVNDKNVVEPRPVQLGRRVGSDITILAGLKGGERVVVDGLFKSRPGTEVKPVPAKAGPAAPVPGAPPAGAPAKAPAAAPADATKKK
ncbi:MAG: efflux RND transporter periplasmic adaptor subunit [Betaproteobacteria bacterium]|nr:efflux RND transporter periplasmic adaptor subunit [Betaproteobacteria bacterium]